MIRCLRRRAARAEEHWDAPEPQRPRPEEARCRAIETGRTRLIVTGAMFLAAYAIVGLRMTEIAVLRSPDAASATRRAKPIELEIQRADITDRNDILLATSLPTVSLYAHPRELLDPAEAAAKLAKALPELNARDVLARLSADRAFVYLKRHLTPKEQYEVNALGIPGVYFERDEKRIYPQGPLAAHVVGLTDVDDKGVAGVEKTFNARLSDGRQPVRLSLDVRVQAILRNELQKAMTEFRAVGAAGMVLDVRSGEVIAMVSLPDFDPNAPATTTSEAMFNRVTLGVYEMGSTFKLFNTAIALDSGRASMTSSYDATRPIRISRFTITDYHAQNRWMTVPEILVHSSNIGSAKMAMDFGSEVQRSYMARLGFLKPATIELPEVGAPLVPSPWREINTMTIAYGHGIAVTPLQMVAATAALVNGGVFRPATLLLREPGAEPRRGTQAVRPQTSLNMRALMRMVVTEGTGGKADVPGYQIGGKTGTAEKLGVGGGYRQKSLLSSFIATFPASNPRYVVLAMVDEPKGTKQTYGYATGGWTAAPVVGRSVSQIGPLLGIKPLPEQPKPLAVKQASANKGGRSDAAAE